MRILPDPYPGLHPAFPAWTEGSLHDRTGSFSLVGSAVAWLAPPVGLYAALFKRPRTLEITTKAAAYIFSGAVPIAAGLHYMRDQVRRPFLERQGVEVPDSQFVDRMGFFDADDAFLSGGVAALLISSALKNPSKVLGWKRYVGTFALWGGFSSALWVELRKYKNGYQKTAQIAKQDAELLKEAEKWTPVIASVHNLQKSRQWSQEPTTSSSSGIGRPSLMRPSGSQASLGQPGAAQQPEVLKDGPHIAIQFPEDREPVFRPQTNYEWSSDHEIEDLEKHIASLRARRLRLAQECQWLWVWLSEKEAEFYTNPGSNSGTPDSKEKLRYLEALSAAQRHSWMEVSLVDWMLADSQKRIDQRRSALENQGQVTWRAPATAQTVSPTFALTGARNSIRELEAHENQLRQAQTAMAIEMADPNFDANEDNQIYHPGKQKMVNQKEVLLEAREAMDKQLEEFALQRKVFGQFIEDSEKRAQQGSKNK
ncbi:hypothetical protein PRZ48_000479 [Zasmidium cellare]|uniref:Uncharacterized protein n=1 Tax=Zasmidium cellare TaxID=395010 RepID=A0ABR0EYL7_ZASCE|nr:hypothetical protein PRZ48_000479 [Zasmidium cellare]